MCGPPMWHVGKATVLCQSRTGTRTVLLDSSQSFCLGVAVSAARGIHFPSTFYFLLYGLSFMLSLKRIAKYFLSLIAFAGYKQLIVLSFQVHSPQGAFFFFFLLQ